MSIRNPNILVILGPTASGKSDLALAVAKAVGGEILSVDSMQVYRRMDIGTAKPTKAEQAEVPHHLIDLVDPDESFTVARFVELADATIADLTRRGVPIVATGGTPMYYKALFEGLFDGPPADEALRGQLRQQSGEELHRRLQQVDPATATRVHANDTKRLVRALEVHALTGKPISSFQTDWGSGRPRHPAVWVGLAWEKDALNRRINARTRAMVERGWLEETRALLRDYPVRSPTAGEATGYSELIEHLEERCSLDEAVERIKIGTRQLARRQVKWFRRFPHVQWLSGDTPLEQLCSQVVAYWRAPNQHL